MQALIEDRVVPMQAPHVPRHLFNSLHRQLSIFFSAARFLHLQTHVPYCGLFTHDRRDIHNETATTIEPSIPTDHEGSQTKTHNQTRTVRARRAPVKPHDSDQGAPLPS